jgi:hypothetical protein
MGWWMVRLFLADALAHDYYMLQHDDSEVGWCGVDVMVRERKWFQE